MGMNLTNLLCLTALGLGLGASACNRSQQRDTSREMTGKIQRADSAFSENDPALRTACKGDADCGAGELCYPGRGRCITSYPNPRMLDVSQKLDECRLTNVYFPFDSTDLVEEAQRWLEYDARCLKARNAGVVMISAHADKQGAAEYNLDLSRRRGEMVKGQLERLGLPAQQIEVTARGEKDPLTTGGSEQDHAWNRRVEIRVK